VYHSFYKIDNKTGPGGVYILDNVNITREEKELNQVKNIQDSKYSKAMEDVQTQKNALIKDVNAYVHKLSYDLNNKIKSIHDSIDTEKKKVEKSRTILEEQTNMAKDIIPGGVYILCL
jgi:hypothetical protein